MAFVDFKYESDDGDVYRVRMNPELQAAVAANTEPATAITKPFHVVSSGSPRNFGIIPRKLIATRAFGTAPDNGVKRLEIPVLDPNQIEGDPAPIPIGSTFTYKTFTWTVASINPETEN